MGKIDYFIIELNKPNAIYMSGEQMIGKVKVGVLQHIKINSIEMTVKGSAKTNFKEYRGRRYSADENYLNFKSVLFTSQSNIDLFLEPGDYIYSFSLNLPANLPTSFEHSDGHVRYTIYSKINIPFGYERNAIKYFSVVSPVNLNKNINLRQPSKISSTQEFCCWPCQSDPVNACLSLPKGKNTIFFLKKLYILKSETLKVAMYQAKWSILV